MALKLTKEILLPKGKLEKVIDTIMHKGEAQNAKPLFMCAEAVRNKYYVVLSYLLERHYTTEVNALNENDAQQKQWLKISERRWKKLVGDTWLEIRENLKKANVIEHDSSYSSNGLKNNTGKPFPMAYQLSPNCYDSDFEIGEVTYTVPISARKDKPRKKSNSKAKIKDDTPITSFTDLIESKIAPFDLDKVKAREIYETLKPTADWTKHQDLLIQLKIRNFQPELIATAKTGRIFMDANMINKELRQALVYNGDEPTAEVDIVTSQPTILASLYPEKCAEFIRYKKLVEHGDIYIEIATLTGGDREKAKKLAYKFMFGGTSPIVRKWFKKNFPKLASVVAKYKGNLLSHELQRRESTVILRDMMLNSGIPSISIHDGLRCRVDDKEKCADLIIKSFQKRWDITPQITIEFGNSKYNYHPSS